MRALLTIALCSAACARPGVVGSVDGPVAYHGLLFADERCAARFATARLIDGSELHAFAACVEGLSLAPSRRGHPMPDGVIVTYGPGFELKVRNAQFGTSERHLASIGFSDDAAVTVTPETLEQLRTAGDREPALRDDARAKLARAGIDRARVWFRICVDERGNTTSTPISTSAPAATSLLHAAIEDWRFRPFTWRGAAGAVCALVRVQSPAEPGSTEKLPMTTRPAPFLVIESTAARRIAGSIQPSIDDDLRLSTLRARLTLAAGARYCVDQTGRVVRADIVEPSGSARFHGAILRLLRTWGFEPLLVDGTPTPFCSYVTFGYRVE